MNVNVVRAVLLTTLGMGSVLAAAQPAAAQYGYANVYLDVNPTTYLPGQPVNVWAVVDSGLPWWGEDQTPYVIAWHAAIRIYRDDYEVAAEAHSWQSGGWLGCDCWASPYYPPTGLTASITDYPFGVEHQTSVYVAWGVVTYYLPVYLGEGGWVAFPFTVYNNDWRTVTAGAWHTSSPPAPTISFSPGSSLTGTYGDDVVVTAIVSPSDQGWEAQVSWSGDGEEVPGNPLQRRFTGVGEFSAMATIPEFNAAGVTARVFPALSLDPEEGWALINEGDGHIRITAVVTPSEYSGQLQWLPGSAGETSHDPLIRLVPTSEEAELYVYASMGPGAPQQQALLRVQASCPSIPDEVFRGVSGRLYPYAINTAGMSNDEAQGIRDAFANWTAKNVQSGLNVRYCEVGTQDCPLDAAFTVSEGNAGSVDGAPNYAATDVTVVGGRAVAGETTMSNIAASLLGRDAYRRLAQHELGHVHGMDHASTAPPRSTVMRLPIGSQGRYLPDAPTQCDVDKAFERGQ